MKRNVKPTLSIISIFLMVNELFYGIPFLGGTVILSFGWQPLLLNALLYLILGIILLVDLQNTIKSIAMIPFIGLTGPFVALLPIIDMLTHRVPFSSMIFLIFAVFNAPTYIPNKDSKIIYAQYKDDKNS